MAVRSFGKGYAVGSTLSKPNYRVNAKLLWSLNNTALGRSSAITPYSVKVGKDCIFVSYTDATTTYMQCVGLDGVVKWTQTAAIVATVYLAYYDPIDNALYAELLSGVMGTYKLNATTGAIIWSSPVMSSSQPSMSFRRGETYYRVGSSDGGTTTNRIESIPITGGTWTVLTTLPAGVAIDGRVDMDNSASNIYVRNTNNATNIELRKINLTSLAVTTLNFPNLGSSLSTARTFNKNGSVFAYIQSGAIVTLNNTGLGLISSGVLPQKVTNDNLLAIFPHREDGFFILGRENSNLLFGAIINSSGVADIARFPINNPSPTTINTTGFKVSYRDGILAYTYGNGSTAIFEAVDINQQITILS